MILSALASFLFFYIERTWIFSICLINHYYTYNCCVTYIHSFLFSWYFKNMCCFFFSLYVKKEKRQGQKQSVSEPCYTGQHEKTSQPHFLTIKANKAILVVIQNNENIKSLTWKWEYYVSFKSSSWWRPKMEWKESEYQTYIHQMARNTTPNDDVWQLDVYIKIYWQYNTVFYGCDWTVEH